MPSSDPVSILLTHNRWANEQLLNACEPLSHEQFHQRFDMGPGSLHDTVSHIAGAMTGWSDLLAQREMRPRPDKLPTRTIDELRAMFAAADADILASTSKPIDEVVTGARAGRSYSFTRGAVLTHLMTHGVHHRAQCLNMLRLLGATPPDVSIMTWVMTVDAPMQRA